jgi:hypothetical protein
LKPIWESWPEWLTEATITAYQQGQTPAQIAAVIKRTEGVVRSKLVREGVYISKTQKRKQIVMNMEEYAF